MGTPIATPLKRASGPTAASATVDELLENNWFAQERKKAQQGITKLNLFGSMELRFGILPRISKSQIELLNAIRQSEIRTFGWPIGVMLESRDEYRPRPYGDGVKAEVSIGDGAHGRVSYDYWALRSNGDFYLLQSLFEDSRKPKQIFFDTRIVRVTESLMFAENIYTKLGAPPDARVAIRVSHLGLKGRTLSSASSNRYVSPSVTEENESVSEFFTVLGTMKETRVDDVRKALEPMFMLFDFKQFDPSVYEDIVRSFERGKV